MSTSKAALEGGRYYHIYSHAVGGAELFLCDHDRRHFLSLLARHTPQAMHTLCYCLLGNHFHLLARIRRSPRVRPHLALSHTLNAYTQYFNHRYRFRGGLFQRPFKRKEVTDEHYLVQVIGYIHLNPTHHGLTADFECYPWSSYPTLMSHGMTRLARDETLAYLGGRTSFAEYHRNYKNYLTGEWTFET